VHKFLRETRNFRAADLLKFVRDLEWTYISPAVIRRRAACLSRLRTCAESVP
jgi:hypothetical protein